MHMCIFLFQLPNVKILDKKVTFSVRIKRKGEYVKKKFTLIQFFNETIYNPSAHDKERPYPQVPSVEMTNPLASYRSNCSFSVRFYNRLAGP